MTRRQAGALACTLVAVCWLTPATSAAPAPRRLVITGANVVVDGERMVAGATVVVENGTIVSVAPDTSVAPDASVAPDSSATIPPGSTTEVLDARGRWIIPGLIDAHVHYADWMGELFLRHGVTTVRDVGNDLDRILSLRRDRVIASDRGPRIFACGPLLDGPAPRWGTSMSLAIHDEAAARAAVRRLIAAGVDCLKVYEKLPPSLVAAIVSEAKPHGVPVTAHLGATSLPSALAAGVVSLEHGSGVDYGRCSPDALAEALDLVVRHKTYIVPTLVQLEPPARFAAAGVPDHEMLRRVPAAVVRWWTSRIDRWTPGSSERAARRLDCKKAFVGRLAAAGARIAAGSDTPNPHVIPGVSLLRELELLVEAGMTPVEALKSATIVAAELLGASRLIGSVEPGKTGDLVVLRDDPRQDIRHLRRIDAVVRGGRLAWRRDGALFGAD